VNPHALEGSAPATKGRAVHCAGCMKAFRGSTPQEAADKCRDQERACAVAIGRRPLPDPGYNARQPLPPVRRLDMLREPENAPSANSRPQGVHFGGTTYEPEFDQERLTKQLGRVHRALIGNSACWLTLGELAALTGDPEASISARLRDLRKPAFGGHLVERRARDRSAGLFEYRLVRQ
jgi:hypothetical protein